MKPAITLHNLSKLYHIGAGQRQPYLTLRESLVGALAKPWRRLTRRGEDGANSRTSFWALKDVGFDVQPGEVIGIIGSNGAGKSTLLKVLSRITEPTTGRVRIRGRIGSLLEVGTGFHPELTGRENIYLNGAILGMHRREIQQKFDAIVAFAEIEQFLETPVKRFSSGMYVRLAFAVAAHLEPEILIVDEVLAVGDASFQKKCMGKMSEVAHDGRTILFVSHNMGAVRGLCSRAVWLKHGRVAGDGDVQRITTSYLDSLFKDDNGDNGEVRDPEFPLVISKVVIKNGEGQPTTELRGGDDLVVELHYHTDHRIDFPYFWISIDSQYGPLLAASMLLDGHRPKYVEGTGVLSCTFRNLPLLPQSYTLSVGARGQDGNTFVARSQEAGYFSIGGRMADYGFEAETADLLCWKTSPVVVPYTWRFQGGEEVAVNAFTRLPKS